MPKLIFALQSLSSEPLRLWVEGGLLWRGRRLERRAQGLAQEAVLSYKGLLIGIRLKDLAVQFQ